MPALSLCILWCMFLSGESRKEAICEIAIKTSTIQPYNVIIIQPFKALNRESKERSRKYENRSMYETGTGQFQSRY